MVRIGKLLLSLAIVVGLAFVANYLSKINKVVEFPIWAAGLGVIAGNIPYISNYIKAAAKPEFFIKIGLILLGISVNFGVIMTVGSRGLVQAIIGMPLVFFFAWYMAKLFKIDQKMRAVLATGVSICGVSAAIAAAGSVLAKREHLTYVIALVIMFALPLMVIIPYTAQAMNLSQEVAGAWIGNNIDTTAAVTGAAQIYGANAVKVASVVKMSQNLFIGVVAFLLALYFSLKVERGRSKPKPIEMWHRFPKFVLGFIVVSILVTTGVFSKGEINTLNALRNWFFCLAFVSIGLSFNFKDMRHVGGRPLLVFALATIFNTVLALGLAFLLFGGYKM